MPFRPKLIALVAALPVAALVWLASGERSSEASPQNATSLSVAALVSRLNAADVALRVEAERELLRRGDDDRLLLPRPDQTDDFHLRTALERLQLERQRSFFTAALNGSHVSHTWKLDPPNPFGSVLQAFTMKTTNEFDLEPDQIGRPVVFDERHVLFWRALDDVCAQAGLAMIEPGGAFITFRERLPGDDFARRDYRGAFRIAAGPVLRTRNEHGVPVLRVPMNVRIEPRLTLVALSFSAPGVTLRTAAERELTPLAGEERRIPLPSGAHGVQFDLDFPDPGEPVTEPLVLGGKGIAELGTGASFRFMIDRATTPHEAARGEVAVRIVDLSRDEEGSLDVEVEYLGPVLRSISGWWGGASGLLSLHDRDAPGRIEMKEPVAVSPVQRRRRGENLRFRFENVPSQRDLDFHLRVGSTVEVPIAFSIDGLTLPNVSAGSVAGP